ncbi:mitochondrial proton/calcium exchanger protein-like protein isoform X1 [Tanacetum coccineum]
MLSLRERMELDLEARLMGETLVLNRSLDPFFEDYIELNDLNVPLELRRDQVDDLMPTIKEGEVIKEFRARNDARMVSKVFGYPSDCDHDKKIRMDCAYNLKFSCMIDFAVLEDMDAYRDKGMGDEYDGFIQNHNMHGMGKTVNELHSMLKLHEETLPKKEVSPMLHALRAGRIQKYNKNKKPLKVFKGKDQGKGNSKLAYAPKPKIPPPPNKDNPTKDMIYHQCGEVGHWRRNCL